MEKYEISNICEDLYKECIKEIPQYENGELIWFMNGSSLCNILYNVIKIDDIKVSDEFNKYCYDFIRQPKGDIDIIYKNDRKYVFDFNNDVIKKYQEISKEKRTYNFVDHNDILSDIDFKQICIMETKSGFRFVAKKPQYIFLYKFKELLDLYKKELLNNDIQAINMKNSTIFNDVINLYNIAVNFCGIDGVVEVLNILPNISKILSELYLSDKEVYDELIRVSIDLLNSYSLKDNRLYSKI